MPVLSLTGNYAEKVLSYYLWGQATPPAPDEIADSRFIDLRSKTFTLNVDAQQYMNKVGNNIVLGEQIMFQRFFNNKTRDDRDVTLAMIQQTAQGNTSPNANEIVLTHDQFVDLFYKDGQGHKLPQYKQADSGKLDSAQYTTDTGSADYWQRAFVFGSTQLQMDEKRVKYVFDAATGKALRIDDIYVTPETDQFDFDSNDGTAKAINPVLKQIMDPSGIGKEIKISYINNQYFKLNSGSFSLAEYRAYVNDPGAPYPETPGPDFSAFFEGFKTLKNSGAFDYLDDHGRVVIFGSKDSDTITECQAKNLNMDGSVDLSSLGDLLKDKPKLKEFINFIKFLNPSIQIGTALTIKLIEKLANPFKGYVSNGIVYVGGEDDDFVTGTEYNDKLIGGKGYDVLDGGKGDDIFLVEGEDDDSNAYDIFKGGDGDDTIIGSEKRDVIRVHEFEGKNTVELIDGQGVSKGGGKDVLVGTSMADTLDLSETELKNIAEIQLEQGADILRLHERKFDKKLKRIDGGEGEDTITGTISGGIGDPEMEIDLHGMTLANIEKYETGDDVDSINLEDATIEGDITSINTKGDDDTINLKNLSAASSTIDEILAGDGDNTIDLTGLKARSIDKIEGGADDDTFTLSGISVQKIDTISLGDGKNTITADTVSSLQFGDITGGKGKDNYTFSNGSSLQFGVIDLGNNDNRVNFNHIDGLTILGIELGGSEVLINDHSTLNISDSRIDSIDFIHGGRGNNSFIFSNTQFGTIDEIRGGQEKDEVIFNNLTIDSHIDMDLMDGENTFQFNSTTINVDGVYSGGSGKDTFELSSAVINAEIVLAGGGGKNTYNLAGARVSAPQIRILGGDDTDIVNGSDGNEIISGGGGKDVLKGGGGNDSLDGGYGKDILEGGEGVDEYNAYDGDIIEDSDQKGKVYFYVYNSLAGGKQKEVGSSEYEGNQGETYFWNGGTLKVKYNGKSLTIKNFSNNALGIHLNKKDPDPPPLLAPPRPSYGDPLVLDLGGDGILTTGLAAGIHFDHNGDGFKELSGFVNADDGLLVLDRNQDGDINDGRELFGDSTRLLDGSIAQHGFEALSEFDDQKDGKIDKNDAIFDKLRIFQDNNQNGQVDDGELFSLAEKKIASLNLTYDESSFVDKFGNIHRQLGTYVTESGEERTMTDVVFTLDLARTTTEMLDVPSEIAVLPDAIAYGTTYTLHQAMVRDQSGRLQELVEQYVASDDRQKRQDLVENILYVWTGEEEGLAEGFGNKQQNVLDSFFGVSLGDNWLRATERFDQLKDMVTYQLSRETHLKKLFDNISYSYNEDADTWVGRYDNVVPVLARMLAEGSQQNHKFVQEFTQCIHGINPYNDLNAAAFRQEVADYIEDTAVFASYSTEVQGLLISLAVGATELDDVMEGGAKGGLLYGFTGNDSIDGQQGNDTIIGGQGNDSLLGGEGDDILIGGVGNDELQGGSGNDIYRLKKGFGNDSITNYDTDAGRFDCIEFTDETTAVDLAFSRHGDTLVITVAGSGDQLRIENHFYLDSTGGYAVDQIRFADGSSLAIGSSGFEVLNNEVNTITGNADQLHGSLGDDDINGLAGDDSLYGKGGNDTLTGSDGDDLLSGQDGNDILDGGAGSDTVHGGNGNDQLFGGAGDDELYGVAGTNSLSGGTGNDYLVGGSGADIFSYGLGDGRDNISNRNGSGGASDILELTGGIGVDDVALRREYNDLLLQISDGGEIWIENFFLHELPSLSEIRFADGSGTVWNQEKIFELVREGTAANDFLYGSGDADVFHGLAGNDRIEGYSGDDQLHGDEGNDSLYGAVGNDELLGGVGNDHLYGGKGNDTLIGGVGVDVLLGGRGDDVYFYSQGFGQDIINNYAFNGEIDVLVFDASFTSDQIIAERRANNLVLGVDGSQDSITISNYFLGIDAQQSYLVEEIRFADGTVWGTADIKQLTIRQTVGDDIIYGYVEGDIFDGLAGNDEIHGADGSDQLSGNSGDDYLYGDAGNDTLLGNDGADVLYGGNGADILQGGGGDDILSGGNGSDLFLFDVGFGNDRIVGYSNTPTEIIRFGTGITASQFSVQRKDRDLVLQSTISDDSLNIGTFFNPGETRAAGTPFVFEFADGSHLDFDLLVDNSFIATDGADYLFGYEEDNTLDGGAGNDTLVGNGGADNLSGGDGNDSLAGGAGNDQVDGGTGRDYLQGGSGDDQLVGGEDADSLRGGAGNDTLTGGACNDYLTGGAGNDVYIYSAGFGHDTIDNYYNANTDAFDVIRFDETIEEVKALRKGNNLTLLVTATGDQVTVNNYFLRHARGNYIVNEIQFADGRVWDIPTVKALVLAATSDADEIHGYDTDDIIDGLEGADLLFGHEGADSLSGNIGADRLEGGEGDDSLFGGIGADTLSGGVGNDILTGGVGSDFLSGGTGDDVYLFSTGFGHDTIDNHNDNTDAFDVIRFDETIGEVKAVREGNNLGLLVTATGDQIKVNNYFYGHGSWNYTVNEIQFADGSVWDLSTVKTLVLSATSAADELHGYERNDFIDGLEGADLLFGHEGADTLSGNVGADRLEGGEGNDSLLGGIGADTLSGGTGNDTLIGGTGDDYLSGGVGNDTLTGGAGDDFLTGDGGNDVYLFSTGFGHDTIANYYNAGIGSFDVIRFDETIDDVEARREGKNLNLLVTATGDQITVNDYFHDNGNYLVNEIQFADGRVWDLSMVKTLALSATSAADELHGYEMDDTLDGLAGDDTLFGYAGDDQLAGGEGADKLLGGQGNDTISGDADSDTLIGDTGADALYGGNGIDLIDGGIGNDTLVGGKGNDTLNGGEGDDKYIFAKGDGNDTIYEDYQGPISIFLQDIDLESLIFRRDSGHLVVSFLGSVGDSISLYDFFDGETPRTDIRIIYGNNEQLVLDASSIISKTLEGSPLDDVITGYDTDDIISAAVGDDKAYAGDGNDTLSGGEGRDSLYGDIGDDCLHGDSGADKLFGGAGADYLSGDIGTDTLLGGNGNDTLTGGMNNDMLYGGTNDDFLYGDSGADYLAGDAGADSLSGGTGGDTLSGGDGNDTLTGGAGADTLLGGDGSDTLTGGVDNDVLKAGRGNDLYIFSPGFGSDALFDIGGNDRVQFDQISPENLLLRREGNDLVVTDRLNNDTLRIQKHFSAKAGQVSAYAVEQFVFADGTVWDYARIMSQSSAGGADADTIQGHAEDDTIHSGAGDDTVFAGSGNDVVIGGQGVDELHGQEGNDTLKGGLGADLLYGEGGRDLLQGGAGADILDGGSGSDTMEGGSGDDIYYVDATGDTLLEVAGEGVDTVYSVIDYTLAANIENLVAGQDIWRIKLSGNNLANVITGGNRISILYGMAGDDTLYGGSGDDSLDGGSGDDEMRGMEGNDIYVIDSVGDVVTELAGEGLDAVYTSIDYTLGANLEWLVLTGDADLNATGNELDNNLWGNTGNNILDGGEGGDYMAGGAGNDIYYTDTAPGGYNVSGDTISERAGEGIDTEIRGYEGGYFLAGNVENLILAGSFSQGSGNELDNILTGNDAVNTLWGLAGDDTLYGLGGDDQLLGDVGKDHLEGGAGDDLLRGGVGDDSLLGGLGNDQLNGGAGINYLRGGAGDDCYIYGSDGGVYEIDASDGGADWLLFTDDLTRDRLIFLRSENDLVIQVDNDISRQVSVKNWFAGEQYQLNSIQPAGMSGLSTASINAMFPPSGAEADTITVPSEGFAPLYGTLENDDQLIGSSANEIIRGFQGNDNLFAREGDDWLLGGSGNDYLDGGFGNDTLHAGAGNDRYVFKSGYGEETIDNSGGGLDRLLFADGLTQDKLAFSQAGDDLVITVSGSGDRVTIRNWFLGEDWQIDYIHPEGAYGIAAAQITELINQNSDPDFTVVDGSAADDQLVGTSGRDQINGFAGADQLSGVAGDDELTGGDGNDVLDGGAGDDLQYGNAGNDQLGGDNGNDTLVGGSGNDTYLYSPGSGNDTIVNSGGGNDRLIFTDDITGDRLSYLQAGNDLRIAIDAGTVGMVTVQDWFKGGQYQLSFIQPAGQDAVSAAEINALFAVPDPSPVVDLEVPDESAFDLVRTGTSAAEQVVGSSGKDLLKGLAGDDQLFAFAGDDWLLGGAGDDYFDGGAGNDTMLGGDGNDQLGGDAGNDVLSAGAGDDVYVYRPGSGNDIIVNSGGGIDWLIFTDTITADRLRYIQAGDDLRITIDDGAAGMVTVQDWFKGEEHQLSYIQPAGGYGIPAGSLNIQQQSEAAAPEGGDENAAPTGTVIDNFVSGQTVLQLSRASFTALPDEGPLDEGFFAANATGSALDNNDYILYNTTTGALLYDADGNGSGGATQFATLTNAPAVKASDFLVVS